MGFTELFARPGATATAQQQPPTTPLPTRDPQLPPSRPNPVSLRPLSERPDVRRSLEYLRAQPEYSQYLRDYQAALQAGQPPPTAPRIAPPIQRRPATSPTIEAARAGRPTPPPNPTPAPYQRSAAQAGRSAEQIRLTLPGQPAPQPIAPPRSPLMPWQRQAAGRNGGLSLLPSPEVIRQRDYIANNPDYQRYMREYAEAMRTGNRPPSAPTIEPMPSNYQPRSTSPSGVPQSRPAAQIQPPRPALTLDPTPALPTQHRPPRSGALAPNPRPQPPQLPTGFAEPRRPAPAPLLARPATRPPTPGGRPAPPRLRPGAIGRGSSRIPIPIPIPQFAPPRPVLFPNTPVLGNLSRGINGLQDILTGFLPGANLADQLGRTAGPAFARLVRPDLRRPATGPISGPVPQPLPVPPTYSYEYIIISREIRPSVNSPWSPLVGQLPSHPNRFNGPVTLSRNLEYGEPTATGFRQWKDVLRVQDRVQSYEQNIYSGIVAPNETPDQFYRNVQITPYIFADGTAAPLPNWEPIPTGQPQPQPQPVNPYSPYPPPQSQPQPQPPPSPFLPAIPAIARPGSPSQRRSPPSSTPTRTPPATGSPIIPFWAGGATPAPAPTPARGSSSIPTPPTEDNNLALCRFRDDPYSAAIRQDTIAANQKLDSLLGLLGDGAILQRINSFENNMNLRLGPQLNGGIGTVLKNFAKSNLVQSFINMLTFIAALHNAFMLSNNLRLTLFSAFDIIYQLPGMDRFAPKDPETGETVDYGSWASDQFDSVLRAAFGDQNVESVRANWNRASRVYQAGANLLFSVQSMMWSLMEAVEVVGNYVAKIGNALKKFGVVTENAYGWMNPQAADSRRMTRVFNAINNASEAIENVEQIAGATLDVTETAAQLGQQSETFTNALSGLDEQGQPLPGLTAFPYASDPEPVPIANIEGGEAENARELIQPIQPSDEQRQEAEE